MNYQLFEPNSAQPQKDTFVIQTLGNFHVFYNEKDLTSSLNKSLKVWELFKYFLTFRDELLLPEKIIQSLWPEADYTDPKRTLRALIFRLRKALSLEGSNEENGIIVYSNGCYKFQTNGSCTLDVVEFEQLFRQAYDTSKNDDNHAIELFKKVSALYKGEYLSDTQGYDWLMPARNYYRRMYLQSVYEACELLKEAKRYQEIISLCEPALKHELFEEELHLFYIEALAAMGKLKPARSHYEYVKQLFEKELGVQPSNALTQVYRMLFGEISKTGLDMNYIKENLLEESMPHGPMVCDKEFFKSLQQLESRRAERYGPTNFLGVITLLSSELVLPEQRQLQEGMKEMKQLLLTCLRKGDVATEWNEAQFLLSLPALNDKQAEIPLTRLKKQFAEAGSKLGLTMNFKIQEALPAEFFQR